VLQLYQDDIKRRYFKAAEYRFRVTHQQMIRYLQRLQDTWQQLEHFKSYLKTNIFASGTSVLNRIHNAIEAMDVLVKYNINDKMFKEIDNYMEAYTIYKEPSIRTIKVAYGEIITATTAFSDILFTYNYEIGWETRIREYSNLLYTGNKLLSTLNQWVYTIQFYHGKKAVKGKYLPEYPISNVTMRKSCNISKQISFLDYRQSVVEVVNDIKQSFLSQDFHRYDYTVPPSERCHEDLDFPEVSGASETLSSENGQRTCYSKWANHSNLANLYAKIRKLQKAIKQSEMCYSEYGNFLWKINNWLQRVDTDKKEQIDESHVILGMIHDINEASVWLHDLIEQLMLNKMPLYDVARELQIHWRDKFDLKLENVQQSMLRLVITPLEIQIDKTRDSINNIFMEALTYHEQFSTYFSDSIKYKLTKTARSLVIWRKPVPNLDSPKVIIFLIVVSNSNSVFP